MSEIDVVKSGTTQKNYMDFLRPAALSDARNIFKKLHLKEGGSSSDALYIASDAANALMSLKGSEIDQVWDRVERALNDGNDIKVKGKSDFDKLNTALGLFYSALEVIDAKDDYTDNVRSLRSIYSKVRGQVFSRFQGRAEGKDKRNLQRTLDTIDSLFDRVTTSFNQRIAEGKAGGKELTQYFSADRS
jgi:hypothetical protein